MSITAIDKQYVANTYNRFGIELTHGKGSIVCDTNNKEYIDMGTGIGVTAFGYCDKVWCDAITKQLTKLQHTSNLYYTEPCAHLAQLLCNKTGFKKVFFANSGAEANECAIKAARKYGMASDRYKILTLEGSFHGRTLTTLAATGQEHYHELFTPLTDGFVHTPVNDFEKLKDTALSNNVCAVMVECIQGEGGVITLDAEFLKSTYEFCKANDILLIVDEVQTGNGRTGKLYAYMNYGITPDIVTTAKGLGGGLPIGACMLNNKVENIFAYGDHGSTYGGNPVCSAGAISVIERLDDKFLKEVTKKSEYIFGELNGADGIEALSGMGLMVGIKTTAPAGDVVKECINRGVLCLTAKDKVRLLPALNIDCDTLKKAITIIKEVCYELKK